MRLTFFIHEAIRAMRRNAAPSFAALATVLVTMLVVGVFIPAVEVTNDAANTVRGRLSVDVYMRTNATSSDDARVRREILSVAHVRAVQFESKTQAYNQQARQNPSAYALLGGTNPLPDTFHVLRQRSPHLPIQRPAHHQLLAGLSVPDRSLGQWPLTPPSAACDYAELMPTSRRRIPGSAPSFW